MIGYTVNGYQLWDPVNRKVIYGCNVVFDEYKTIETLRISKREVLEERETEWTELNLKIGKKKR